MIERMMYRMIRIRGLLFGCIESGIYIHVYLTISCKNPQLVDVSKFAVTNCGKCAIVVYVRRMTCKTGAAARAAGEGEDLQ
jgi:hypothetical protein